MTKDKSDTASVDINDTEVIHIHKNGKNMVFLIIMTSKFLSKSFNHS